jgi:hypothetical protein
MRGVVVGASSENKALSAILAYFGKRQVNQSIRAK